MAILEIPVTVELDRYSQTVAIEDVEYRFLFAYNTRMELWTLSVTTVDGDDLATGIPLVANSSLLGRWGGVDALPRDGQLMLVDISGEDREPLRESLGDSHRLLWIPDDDV